VQGYNKATEHKPPLLCWVTEGRQNRTYFWDWIRHAYARVYPLHSREASSPTLQSWTWSQRCLCLLTTLTWAIQLPCLWAQALLPLVWAAHQISFSSLGDFRLKFSLELDPPSICLVFSQSPPILKIVPKVTHFKTIVKSRGILLCNMILHRSWCFTAQVWATCIQKGLWQSIIPFCASSKAVILSCLSLRLGLGALPTVCEQLKYVQWASSYSVLPLKPFLDFPQWLRSICCLGRIPHLSRHQSGFAYKCTV
jgi:hypothetical protein